MPDVFFEWLVALFLCAGALAYRVECGYADPAETWCAFLGVTVASFIFFAVVCLTGG